MGSTTLTRDVLNSEANQIDYAIKQKMLQINTAIPCEVQSYNSTTRTCNIMPIINNIDGSGNPIQPPILYNVPISDDVGNDCGLEIEYVKGDIVIVLFCQRDISNLKTWWNNGNTTINSSFNPASYRLFNIADGIIIKRISNKPPTVKIKIASDGISIQAVGLPVDINCETTNINSTSKVNITAPEINLNGPVKVTGALTSTVSVTAPTVTGGTTTISNAGINNSSGDVNINGAPFRAHEHSAGTYSAPNGAVSGVSGAITP